MNASTFLQQPDLGKLLLRVFTGFILFLHGFGKIVDGMGGTAAMLESNGLPGWLAYGTLLGEVVGPLLLIVGKFSRLGGLLIAFNMLMTVVTVHRDIAFQFNDYGAWMIELNVMLLIGGLAVALLGAGRYSLSGGKGRWD